MSKKILVVDDDEMILFVIRELLEDMGHSVTGVSDPHEAIQLAVDEDYDLIILDLRMPDIDGAELTDRILSR
jgi:CheY-like chemotaxis protein